MGLVGRIMTDNVKHDGECLSILTHATAFETVGVWEQPVWQRAEAHQVALEPDEVDPHGEGAVGVAAEGLDPVHQVGTELVASFQHAQHHDVMVPKVIHDVSSQTFCPVNNVVKSELPL